MAYKRKSLAVAVMEAGMKVRRNGSMLLFFAQSGKALFMVRDDGVCDPRGMYFETAAVPDASDTEAEKFPNDGGGF